MAPGSTREEIEDYAESTAIAMADRSELDDFDVTLHCETVDIKFEGEPV